MVGEAVVVTIGAVCVSLAWLRASMEESRTRYDLAQAAFDRAAAFKRAEDAETKATVSIAKLDEIERRLRAAEARIESHGYKIGGRA